MGASESKSLFENSLLGENNNNRLINYYNSEKENIDYDLSAEIINKIGKNAGINMNVYIPKIIMFNNERLLIFQDKSNRGIRSIYTLNLYTLKPTRKSPIQKTLSYELEMEIKNN